MLAGAKRVVASADGSGAVVREGHWSTLSGEGALVLENEADLDESQRESDDTDDFESAYGDDLRNELASFRRAMVVELGGLRGRVEEMFSLVTDVAGHFR